MAYNKIVHKGKVLIDLTSDTITTESLLQGETAHDRSGNVITGACDFDSNTFDANVSESEILLGKTAYARSTKLTGTMANNGSVELEISQSNQEIQIPTGYHNGSGCVKISSNEQEKIIPANIREGITILGIDGTMSGTEGMKAQQKDVIPSTADQTIVPDAEYNCLNQVTVKAIPYVESQNDAGGITVTIG